MTETGQRQDREIRKKTNLLESSAAFAIRRPDTWVVALVYSALTLAFTWPLAWGLARDIPGDFGDPLLNAWIVAWGASHVGPGWWNANIYFPHPLTLGYSEHLLPQALQVLPIYAITRNPILCYNLLFLSTFVLSALGMFLFAREITGSRNAAFVAGVAYAFAPYRVTSMPHLQVLSSAWMPFVLYGFRRFFVRVNDETHREGPARTWRSISGSDVWPLAGATAAWIAQNLSCGYYLLFFSPVVVGYLIWEMSTRALWRHRRVAILVLLACAAAATLTLAVILPYFELRQLGFRPRSIDETTRFSADVFAYLTADPNLRLWGPLIHAWPHPEGALFPGFTIFALAIVATLAAKRARTPFLYASLAILLALLCGWSIRLPGLRIASFPRALVIVSGLYAIVLITSARTRQTVRQWLSAPAGFFTMVALIAIVMSWGPSINAKGRPIASASLYTLFYNYAPGFDGLRVPARFSMVATLALALLAGLGLTAISRFVRSRLVTIVATGAILLESVAVPIPVNENSVSYSRQGLAPLPDSVWPVPAVYGFLGSLPPTAAIIELPLGEPAFDARYVFYSTTHWRRIVNGYSGGAPVEYEHLDQSLRDTFTRPDRAWQALVDSQATHAIVHEGSYTGDGGLRISQWLRSRGAAELGQFGSDRIFRIR